MDEQNGIITFYSIHLTEIHSGDTVYEQSLEGSDRQEIINNLHPYYRYLCSVSAATQIGLGPAATAEVQTLQEGVLILCMHSKT